MTSSTYVPKWQNTVPAKGILQNSQVKAAKGRRQNSPSLTTNLSQNVTEPSMGISYPVGNLCQRFTKRFTKLPMHYIVIGYPQQMVQMAFCDLSHTFHKQVTNVSQHVFAILLWGMLCLPFKQAKVFHYHYI